MRVHGRKIWTSENTRLCTTKEFLERSDKLFAGLEDHEIREYVELTEGSFFYFPDDFDGLKKAPFDFELPSDLTIISCEVTPDWKEDWSIVPIRGYFQIEDTTYFFVMEWIPKEKRWFKLRYFFHENGNCPYCEH